MSCQSLVELKVSSQRDRVLEETRLKPSSYTEGLDISYWTEDLSHPESVPVLGYPFPPLTMPMQTKACGHACGCQSLPEKALILWT